MATAEFSKFVGILSEALWSLGVSKSPVFHGFYDVSQLVSLWFCFPGGSDSKESDYSAGDICLIPGLGKFSGGVNGYPL